MQRARVHARLKADDGSHAGRARRSREFFGLGEIAAEGPFAEDVFTRCKRCEHEIAMRRDADADDDEIDVRIDN